jgi:hypothetical protein
VIGNSRMRTPQALKTAFTRATQGRNDACFGHANYHFALISVVDHGTISGISSEPGNL